MNIKYGMDNFYVRYLKRFLHQELNQDSNNILGSFDKNDMQQLVTYLNMPNVKDMFNVQKEIIEKFPELNTRFTFRLKDNEIIFKSKYISETDTDYLTDNLEDIREYCESVGWEVKDLNEWIDITKDINNDGNINEEERAILVDIINNGAVYDPIIMKKADLNLDGVIDDKDLAILDNYLISGKLSLTIKKGNRKNYFPNEDMLIFINQFDGTFLYNYAIRDGRGDTQGDVPHVNNDNLYKVALFKCTPGQKVTIAHNSNKLVHMVIGSSPATLKQNIPGFKLNNIQEVDLLQGEGFQYTCSKASDGTGYNAHWLCIQVPSNYGELGGRKEVTITIELGDINLDGEVNMQDYHLLAKYTAYGPGSEELKWTPTRRQLAAMDLNGDGVVDNKDTLRFEDYLNGYIPSLGIAPYTYTVQDDAQEGDNVENLLIIQGHYYNYNSSTQTYDTGKCINGTINIPFSEFTNDDWIIHEKFFNYLLGMTIQPYSDSTNITYAQKLLKEAYPEHMYDESYFYPGNYSDKMKNLVKDFQLAHYYYTKGDLNKDNKLDSVDLQLLRDYLDDPQHKAWEEDPYNNEDSNLLSEIQKIRADVNSDGYRNELDYQILEKEVNRETEILRNYTISYNLGWIDVDTEALLEEEYNSQGNISEVSK